MPKASNTSQDKKGKLSAAEEKDGKKSLSKPKSDSSYNKFVENAAKVSGKNENNGRRSTSKAEEGEKQKSRTRSKKMILKAPKKSAEIKSKQKKKNHPHLGLKPGKKVWAKNQSLPLWEAKVTAIPEVSKESLHH